MRTCSVLLEPELAHERWVEGLEATIEGFEDLHISLLGDCHCCARFFDEDWSEDASGRDCSPHRALRRVQGIGGYFIGSGGPQKTIVLEFAFSSRWKWASSEVRRTLRKLGISSIFSSTLTDIALLRFFSEAVRVCILYS